MKLGAYIQLYKNDGKGELMIKNFRKFYPNPINSPIYLVSDNGDDFTELAEKYGCKYEHSLINTGVKNNGFTKEEMLVWLDRFQRCFAYCRTEYIIYLEDDVLVRKEINIDKNKKICGVKAGNLIPNQVFDFLRNKYGKNIVNTEGGACGGTIYDMLTFLKIYPQIIDLINESFDELYNIYINIGCLDQFIPIAYAFAGIQYDKNDEIIETGRDPRWRDTSHAIVHINGNAENIFAEIK
jgi:hypothetical protein